MHFTHEASVFQITDAQKTIGICGPKCPEMLVVFLEGSNRSRVVT